MNCPKCKIPDHIQIYDTSIKRFIRMLFGNNRYMCISCQITWRKNEPSNYLKLHSQKNNLDDLDDYEILSFKINDRANGLQIIKTLNNGRGIIECTGPFATFPEKICEFVKSLAVCEKKNIALDLSKVDQTPSVLELLKTLTEIIAATDRKLCVIGLTVEMRHSFSRYLINHKISHRVELLDN